MNIDLKEYISGREDLFTATNVVEMEECLTKFLEWHKAVISVTRSCTELKTKERIAFHVYAEINNYTKCFRGYRKDNEVFSETFVLKKYNDYLQNL